MRNFTQQEKEDFNQAANELAALGLCAADDDRGKQNTATLKTFLESNPQFRVTVATVKELCLGALKEQLNWKSAAQQAADTAASSLTQDEVNTILAWIPTRGLQGDGDNLLTNFAIIANWMVQNRRTIIYPDLDLALGNIASSAHGYRLRFVKRLQDREAEVERQRDQAAKTPARQEQTQLVNNDPAVRPLPGHLQAHREMLRRPVEGQEPSKPATNEWRNKAEAVLNNTNSNVDRAKAEKLKGYINGDINWEATYNLRRRYLEQRKLERQNAGR